MTKTREILLSSVALVAVLCSVFFCFAPLMTASAADNGYYFQGFDGQYRIGDDVMTGRSTATGLYYPDDSSVIPSIRVSLGSSGTYYSSSHLQDMEFVFYVPLGPLTGRVFTYSAEYTTSASGLSGLPSPASFGVTFELVFQFLDAELHLYSLQLLTSSDVYPLWFDGFTVGLSFAIPPVVNELDVSNTVWDILPAGTSVDLSSYFEVGITHYVAVPVVLHLIGTHLPVGNFDSANLSTIYSYFEFGRMGSGDSFVNLVNSTGPYDFGCSIVAYSEINLTFSPTSAYLEFGSDVILDEVTYSILNLIAVKGTVSDANQAAYESGVLAGYNQGHSAGYDSGYSVGYQSGISYADTRVNKKSASWFAGVQQGVSDSGNYTFLSLFSAILDAPVRALFGYTVIENGVSVKYPGLFSFEVFGVSLSSLYLSLFSACIVFVVIRFALGRS